MRSGHNPDIFALPYLAASAGLRAIRPTLNKALFQLKPFGVVGAKLVIRLFGSKKLIPFLVTLGSNELIPFLFNASKRFCLLRLSVYVVLTSIGLSNLSTPTVTVGVGRFVYCLDL